MFLKFIESYFNNLAQHPQYFDSIVKWNLCVFALWFFIWKYRETIISGLEGINLKLEGGEATILLGLLAFPPIIFNVAFFETTAIQLYALYADLAILAYALAGRYLFDWALAFKTGQSKVTPAVDVTTTTTTETEVK